MCNRLVDAAAIGDHQQEHSSSKPPNSDAETHEVETPEATNSSLPKAPAARLHTLSPSPPLVHDAQLHTGETGTVQDSTLLKLPPELRNRIYAYVLGGLTVHVDYRPCDDDDRDDEGYDIRPVDRTTVRCLCCAERSDSTVHAVLQKLDHFLISGGDFTNPDSSSRNHLACGSGQTKFGEILGLLLVCRQVYREAALLPYSLDTFFVRGILTLHCLERTLKSAQSGALRSLTLQDRLLRAGANGRIASSVKSLTGLRHLSLFGEMETRMCYRTREEQEMGDTQYQDSLTKGLLLFAYLQLESVSVSITPAETFWCESNDGPQLYCEEAKQWSRRLEKSLLHSNSQIAGGAESGAAPSLGMEEGLL